MTPSDRPGITTALTAAITAAMKQRDRTATTVYRSALAAIANAEAVPVDVRPGAGALEHAAVGVGSSEAQRRTLSDQKMIDIVLGEVVERTTAAELLQATNPEAPAGLRREADLLSEFLLRVSSR